MSLSKRIFDLARANLNALLDKAGGGETSIDELTDDELEAELRRRRERRLREDEERAAARRAAEHARTRAAANAAASATRAASAGSAQTRGNRAREERRPPLSAAAVSERRLRELYAQLEVPYGAGFDEVKKSFRRLMRKYHPDLHLGNPQKHKTATQLTMSLTQAYNELELHLVGGPNKGTR